MQVDESGAPWPYEPHEPASDEPGEPTWDCPAGECQCHAPQGEAERDDHKILFFDGEAKKMPGARCRVIENGQLLNKEAPYADGSGAIPVKVRSSTRTLEVEWAPGDVPDRAGLPYRKLYHLDLGEAREQGVHRRLHNIGFLHHPSLDENVKDFQRAYQRPVTGRMEDIEVELASFHDDGTLPPVAGGGGNDSGDDTKAKSQLVGDKGDAKALTPAAAPGGSGPAAGGKKKQGSAAAVKMTKLRVRVRTRAARMIDKAHVTIDVGGTKFEKDTDLKGFATITLTEEELGKSKKNRVDVEAKKLHHGPEPRGAQAVTPGPAKCNALVEPGKGWSDAQNDISILDPSTPGVEHDAQGPFLDFVLRDACMNRAAVSSKVTRRMEDDEVQKELMFRHISAALMLTAQSEFQFKHDTSTGEFGACTDKCELVSPKVTTRVSLAKPKIASVTFCILGNKTTPSTPDKKDAIPGQRFLRERFSWEATELQALDQRHAVGLARLCAELRDNHQISIIYTQGVNGDSSRGDCHGYGLALDFGGCSTLLPSPDVMKKKAKGSLPVRMEVDFLVFLHWGRVPMWDPTTVAKDPTNQSSWTRFPEDNTDKGSIDYRTDPNGTSKKLHYRLDAAPYQEASPDPPPVADLDRVASHFKTASALFKAIYDFAVKEYSDNNDDLKKLPQGKTDTPTPIDDHLGHFIIHPDYARPNTPKAKTKKKLADGKDGRGAHVNHLHFQLGPTNYFMPDGETPKPRTT